MSFTEQLGLLLEAKKVDTKKIKAEKPKKKPLPIFDKKSPKVIDKKEHFPIGTEAQAKKALEQVKKIDKTPKWYKGEVKDLKATVMKTVKKEYPTFGKKKDKK